MHECMVVGMHKSIPMYSSRLSYSSRLVRGTSCTKLLISSHQVEQLLRREALLMDQLRDAEACLEAARSANGTLEVTLLPISKYFEGLAFFNSPFSVYFPQSSVTAQSVEIAGLRGQLTDLTAHLGAIQQRLLAWGLNPQAIISGRKR